MTSVGNRSVSPESGAFSRGRAPRMGSSHRCGQVVQQCPSAWVEQVGNPAGAAFWDAPLGQATGSSTYTACWRD